MRTLRFAALALLFSIAPALATPQDASGLREVLERWIGAVGGEKRVKGARSVTLRGDLLEEGMAGSLEERIGDTSRRHLSTWGARFAESSFSDGTGWVKDWNGKVREVEGRDRAIEVDVTLVSLDEN